MRVIKNKQDKRYVRNRASINEVFLKHRCRGHNNIDIVQLCQEVGVHTSTFYDHYRNIDAVLPEIEETLYRQFLKTIETIDLQQYSIQNLHIFFRKLLIFVGQHSLYFQRALDHSETEWFLRVFQKTQLLLMGNWRPRQAMILRRWFNLLCFELIGVIYTWGKNEQFELLTMAEYHQQLVKLTWTAEMRFRQLEKH